MRAIDRLRQRRREQRRWAAARTLDDLGELTAQWLEGRVAYQPGYGGPVDVDEDPGLRDTLIRLNRAGLVTECSQGGWVGPGGYSTQMAAVEGFAAPATVEQLRQTLAGAEYEVLVNARHGVPLSHLDGQPYTRFGQRMTRRGIAGRYPGCHRDAIKAVAAADQIVIYDRQIGRNTLWAALDEAVTQLEQENMTMVERKGDVPNLTFGQVTNLTRDQRRLHDEVTAVAGDTGSDCREVLLLMNASPEDKAAVAEVLGGPGAGDEFLPSPEADTHRTQDAADNSVRPGPGNTPGSEYHNDPRVRVDGSGGYTIHSAGTTQHVRYGENGWAMYAEDGTTLITDGYGSPDDLFRDTIGAPHRLSQDEDDDFPGYRDATHLRQLAARCEAGAADLQRAADNPAGVLAERGYNDQPDTAEWGQRKQAAAEVARAYAAGLRAEADGLAVGQRPTPERIAQAEKVATAAECDGILIDGRRLAEAAEAAEWNSPEARQAIRDHQAAEDAAVEGSGAFSHVAETIDGVEQVPFWQLGGNVATNQSDTAAENGAVRASDDAADGW